MAANTNIVKEYEKCIDEVRFREGEISQAVNRLVETEKEQKWLENFGVPEEKISEFRDSIDKTRSRGDNSIAYNKTSMQALVLEMYKDICDQIDELKKLIEAK